MIKIAAKFIAYGMDFQYENFGSQGESLICFECGLTISNKEGSIILDYNGQHEKFEENENSWEFVSSKIEEILMEETT